MRTMLELRALIASADESSINKLRDVVRRSKFQQVGIVDPGSHDWLSIWRSRFDVAIFEAEELLRLIRRRQLRPNALADTLLAILVSSDFQYTEVLHAMGPVYAIPVTLDRTRRLRATIELANSGYSALSPAVLRDLIEDRVRLNSLQRLTPEERRILWLLGQGSSNVAMAEALNLSPTRVKSLVRSTLSKLGFRNRTGAAIFAVRHGLHHPD